MNTRANNFWVKNLIVPISSVLKRFAISILLFSAVSLIVSFLIITDTSPSETMTRIMYTFSVTGILAIGVQILSEKCEKFSRSISFVLLTVYGALFYFFGSIFPYYFFEIFILHIFAFILFFLWIPYKKTKNSEVNYYNFLQQEIIGIFIGIFVAIISGALGTLAIIGTQELFGLSYSFSKYIGVWWALCLGVFGPVYGLSHFPHYSDISEKTFEHDVVSGFITRYILTPFVIIYFIILYAYSVKVLANFGDWPKGIVTSLVLAFSIIGYATYIASKPFDNNFLIGKIRKIFPYAVFFQLFMLFYALYLRIAQYGLTTNRYIVLLGGAVLLGISLYYIFSKQKRLFYIPASFSVVALIFSVGPWNIVNLPERLQFADFTQKIETLGLYKDGKFTKLDTIIHGENTSRDLYSQLNYLCNEGNKCRTIEAYFNAKNHPDFQKFMQRVGYGGDEISSWNIKNFLSEEMNIEAYYPSNYEPKKNEQGYMRLDITNGPLVDPMTLMKVTGFDYMMLLNYSQANITNNVNLQAEWNLGINGVEIGKFDLKPYLKDLVEKYVKDDQKNSLIQIAEGIPAFEAENENFSIQFIPMSIPLDYKDNADYHFANNRMDGTLLIKDKNALIKK